MTTAQQKKKKAKRPPESDGEYKGPRSVPVSMPDWEQLVEFDVMCKMIGLDRAKTVRAILEPHLAIVREILTYDGFVGATGKFECDVTQLPFFYDPNNPELTDEIKQRNYEVFKRAEAQNPKLHFSTLFQPDKVF